MRIDKRYELPFPVEQVYKAWVSSDTVIPPATRMDVNPVVGGHYRLIMETPEFSGKNEGEFTLVEPGSRITYTWEWNGDGEVTTIDIRFSPTGNSNEAIAATAATAATEVTLIHDGFISEESVSNHDSGWDSYIEGFTQYLAGQKTE